MSTLDKLGRIEYNMERQRKNATEDAGRSRDDEAESKRKRKQTTEHL